MNLLHMLPLLSLSITSAVSSHKSLATSQIRPCVNEVCATEATRIRLAKTFGFSEGSGVHKLFFFNTETQRLHSYRIDNVYDQKSKLSFVRVTAYNASDEFKDYVKAVYRLELDIYGTLGIKKPFTINGQSTTGPVADTILDAPMLIHVDADDHYWLGTQAIDARAIGASLEAYQASTKAPKLLVESHHSANTEALIYLVNTAKSVGLAQVSVGTYE